MSGNSQTWSAVVQSFENIWGYTQFRYPQGEIIGAILDGQDTVVVMPTGGGKSICFQLPALLQEGLTLVISPLVALMENQVGELLEKNLPAARLHSELSKAERSATLGQIDSRTLRLLYLSPETLLSPVIWEKLRQPQVKINGLILDEAHCLVQWGDNFRPAYRRLGAVRPALLQYKPEGTKIAIAAFTATANPDAQKIMVDVLKLENPRSFLVNPYRDNLHIKARICLSPYCRRKNLLKVVKSHPIESGLVYVRSRKESQYISGWLESHNYRTKPYHAGLSPSDRRYLEKQWLENNLQFIVCTSAFGMGINKPDVRWVIHYQAPLYLCDYLQEIGRGGRDGKETEVVTLMSEPTGWIDKSDRQKENFFRAQSRQQYQQASHMARLIPGEGTVEDISKAYPGGAIVLSLLHSYNSLEWLDPFRYRLTSKKVKNRIGDKEMSNYLYARGCRWAYLLSAFGFKTNTGWRCGHCDNCGRR
ncbi:MAG: ATP-dependent RNA helicase DbpA [Chroococcopsis gigantea SAG 12.99]|jgi:ATP-dependent DNA helicase RecQ|nr:ATP-dependent DNA helicase RecQ [Chlorogloea purpurea SAG 13.99]MDV3001199.1 ATP-dependent RNA helicase DbpA [Chroococcopsis gigantea SAG 12.99]